MNPNRIYKIIAAMVVTAALGIATTLVTSAPALAASCRNAGGGNGSISVGSQVTGNQVTICASKAFQKQLTKVIKPMPNTKHILNKPPKPAKKPVVKVPVKPVKPLPVKKIKTPAKKPSVLKKKVSGKKANSAVFSPAAPRASVLPGTSLAPGQTASFSVGLGVRFGTATLFSNLVTVRFTPVNYFWSFGDGASTASVAVGAAGSTAGSGVAVGGVGTAQHSYAQGTYTAVAQVEYRVDYRVKGGSWLRDPDTIWLNSNGLNLTVSQGGGNGAGGTTVLVKP